MPTVLLDEGGGFSRSKAIPMPVYSPSSFSDFSISSHVGEDFSQIGASPGSFFSALQRFLPSNNEGSAAAGFGLELGLDPESAHAHAHVHATCGTDDEFRMYEFKVRRCMRGRSHDWTECPYAHPGEKARRRDPRRCHYTGTACPEFRKAGGCPRGDSCEYAHGVFECWLHPARYRTQPCKDGRGCARKVCFFAHTPEQLRVLPPTSRVDGILKPPYVQSPTSTLNVRSPPLSPSDSSSPPLSPSHPFLYSPTTTTTFGFPSNGDEFDISARLTHLHLRSHPDNNGSARTILSPKLPPPSLLSPLSHASSGLLEFECDPEEPIRIESGRELRAKIYSKLRKENPLDSSSHNGAAAPDLGWVNDLVK